MESIEKMVRDSISNYLLAKNTKSEHCIEILTWLKSSSSTIGDFCSTTQASLIESLKTKNEPLLILALIDFLLLDLEEINIFVIDLYFEQLNNVASEQLEIDSVSHSLSIMLSNESVDNKKIGESIEALNFELASNILSTLNLDSFEGNYDFDCDLKKSALNIMRMGLRSGLYWHFILITKPSIANHSPFNNIYRSTRGAANDWAYSKQNSSRYLMSIGAINSKEQIFFDTFGDKLFYFLNAYQEGGLLNSREFTDFCSDCYYKLFQGNDVFETIYSPVGWADFKKPNKNG